MLPSTAAAPSTPISVPMSMPPSPSAASAPATKSSESPGRKGVTTKPVSAKMMTNRMP
jgi:hypothetical protein